MVDNNTYRLRSAVSKALNVAYTESITPALVVLDEHTTFAESASPVSVNTRIEQVDTVASPSMSIGEETGTLTLGLPEDVLPARDVRSSVECEFTISSDSPIDLTTYRVDIDLGYIMTGVVQHYVLQPLLGPNSVRYAMLLSGVMRSALPKYEVIIRYGANSQVVPKPGSIFEFDFSLRVARRTLSVEWRSELAEEESITTDSSFEIL